MSHELAGRLERLLHAIHAMRPQPHPALLDALDEIGAETVKELRDSWSAGVECENDLAAMLTDYRLRDLPLPIRLTAGGCETKRESSESRHAVL